MHADRLLVSGFDQIKWDTATVAGGLSPHYCAAHFAFPFRVLRCFTGNSHLLSPANTSILIVALPRPRSITSLSLTHIPLLHTSNKQACVSTHNLSTHRLCVTTRNVPGRPNQTDSALQSPQGTAVWSWLLSPALLLSARMRRRMVDTRSCMSPRSLHCILFQSNPANMDTVAVR